MSENAQNGLKDYRLSEQVGGYEGLQIYRAIAPGGRILVSVRMFPAVISRYPLLMEKLQTNIQVLKKINHPSISGIIDAGTDSGRPYIVQSHIDAGSLEDRIHTGTLSALNVERVVNELAEGLSAAHKQGIIHGNLKPADILFDQSGTVKIVGFSEALLLRSIPNVSNTISNSFVSFRAPEAINVNKVSEQSDQYSLGLIALQMLTDLPSREARLFLQTEIEKVKMSGRRRYDNTSGLPKQVIEVLGRAMEEKPSKRFPSVKKMNSAFRKALSVDDTHESNIKTVPLHQAPKPKRKRKKSPILVLASLLLFFLVLAAAAPAGIAFVQKNINGSDSPPPVAVGTGQVIMLPPQHGESTPTTDGAEFQSQQPTSTNSVAVKSPASTSAPGKPNPTATPGTNPTFTATPTGVTDGTPAPTDTPTSDPPTSTPAGTQFTDTPSPTDTLTPTPIPTIRPRRCRTDPNRSRYCTPTPSP